LRTRYAATRRHSTTPPGNDIVQNDPMAVLPGPTPLILIIEDQDWSARALETVLGPAGYAILRGYTGEQGLERAFAARPDAILVDTGLPDVTGLDVCTRLRADERVGGVTPIVLMTAGSDNRRMRRQALEAGAWDFVTLPPDSFELLAKLATWIRARREIERVREEGLLDFPTGVYNARGMLQRAHELASEAARYQKPLACVVFTVDASEHLDNPNEPPTELLAAVRDALRATVRTCDTLGRLTAGQFAVLAPATDSTGALRLAERVLHAVERRLGGHGDAQPHIGVGYFGVANYRVVNLDPAELLARATIALRAPLGRSGTDPRIRGYPETWN
jgi:two-component system, cell cycle response regulator